MPNGTLYPNILNGLRKLILKRACFLEGNIRQSLDEAIQQTNSQYYRLVLLVGPAKSGKTGLLKNWATENGFPLVNVNLSLSQKMLELTKNQRSRQVQNLMRELLNSQAGEVVVLDNLEMLFDPALEIDPLGLLKNCSRNQTIVASWTGQYKNGVLTYAEQGHPEYQNYRQLEVNVVTINKTK